MNSKVARQFVISCWCTLLCATGLIGQSSFERIIKISLDSAIVLKNTTNDPLLSCLAHYQIGRKNLKINVDTSIHYNQLGIRMAEKLGNDTLINRMKKSLTYALINRQKMSEAETILKEIEPFYKSHRDGVLYHSWLRNMGYFLTETGRFDEAVYYLTTSLENANKRNYSKDNNNILNSLGILYSRMGLDGKALEYYEKIIYNAEELGQSTLYTAALSNAASKLLAIGQNEKAKDYLLKVIDLRKPQTNRGKYNLLNDRISLAFINRDWPLAINYAKQALAIAKKHNTLHDQLSQEFLLYEFYKKLGQDPEAYQHLENAYKLQQKTENTRSLQKITRHYSDYLIHQGKYREAISIIKSEEAKNRANRLEQAKEVLLKLEVGQFKKTKNIEINNLKLENEKNRIKARSRQTFIFSLLGLSLLLFSLVFILIRNNRSKKQTADLLFEQKKIIEKNLKEKETLLKEIHHRVKNNLQIVSSMLNLQTRYISDEKAKEVVKESRDRVKSMALIHQKLYQDDNLKGVNMNNYIETLASSITHTYKLDSQGVNIEIDITEVVLDVDTAIPIGLIINELITNSVKHAFDDSGGTISVSLSKEHGDLVLMVNDNGAGYSSHENIGFGSKLIESFVRKLQGTITKENKNGTQISIRISNYKEVKI